MFMSTLRNQITHLFQKKSNHLFERDTIHVPKNLILEVGCSKKLSGSEEGIGQADSKT